MLHLFVDIFNTVAQLCRLVCMGMLLMQLRVLSRKNHHLGLSFSSLLALLFLGLLLGLHPENSSRAEILAGNQRDKFPRVGRVTPGLYGFVPRRGLC